jgi:hypothetical protein
MVTSRDSNRICRLRPTVPFANGIARRSTTSIDYTPLAVTIALTWCGIEFAASDGDVQPESILPAEQPIPQIEDLVSIPLDRHCAPEMLDGVLLIVYVAWASRSDAESRAKQVQILANRPWSIAGSWL